MNREDAELARLLRLARQADLPDAERLARVRARFLPPTAAGALPQNGVSGAGAKLGALGAKIVAGLAAVGLAIWAYEPPLQPMPSAPPPVLEPAVNVLSVAGAGTEPVQVEPPEPAPQPEPRRVRKRTKQAPQPAPVRTLAEQAALLQMATVALRAGQLDRASEMLAEFARRYPDSQLTPDRLKLEQRLQQQRASDH